MPLESVGVWRCYWDLLDQATGWEVKGKGSDAIFQSWKKCIDWHKERKIDLLVPAISVRTYAPWPFPLVVDFQEYPEARIYSAEETARNRRLINRILDHAKEAGVKIFVYQYNFAAPRMFIKAHPELKTIYLHEMKMPFQPLLPEKERIYGNVCWSNEVYQDFMRSAYRETFEALPNLSGFFVTIGEFLFCDCEGCRDKGEMAANYVNVLVEEHRKVGRTPLIRTWWVHEFPDVLPKGPTYVVKSDRHDAVNTEPDERVFRWLDYGHNVWVTKTFRGENNNYVLWANSRWVWEAIDRLRKTKVTGVIGYTGDMWPFESDIGSRIGRLNLEAFCYYAKHEEEYDAKKWSKYLEEFFGPGTGDTMLKALFLQSHLLLDISRIVGMPWEGFSMGWWFPYLPPSENPTAFWDLGWGLWPEAPWVLGTINATPPYQWRKNLLSLQDIIGFVRTEKPEPEWLKKFAENMGKTCPLEYLRIMTEEAKEALEMLTVLDAIIRPEAKAEYEDLRKNLKATVCFGDHWLNLLWSKVCYEAVMKRANAVHPRDIEMAISYFEKSLEPLRELEKLIPRKTDDGQSIWFVNRREEELQIVKENLENFPLGKMRKLWRQQFGSEQP